MLIGPIHHRNTLIQWIEINCIFKKRSNINYLVKWYKLLFFQLVSGVSVVKTRHWYAHRAASSKDGSVLLVHSKRFRCSFAQSSTSTGCLFWIFLHYYSVLSFGKKQKKKKSRREKFSIWPIRTLLKAQDSTKMKFLIGIVFVLQVFAVVTAIKRKFVITFEILLFFSALRFARIRERKMCCCCSCYWDGSNMLEIVFVVTLTYANWVLCSFDKDVERIGPYVVQNSVSVRIVSIELIGKRVWGERGSVSITKYPS